MLYLFTQLTLVSSFSELSNLAFMFSEILPSCVDESDLNALDLGRKHELPVRKYYTI